MDKAKLYNLHILSLVVVDIIFLVVKMPRGAHLSEMREKDIKLQSKQILCSCYSMSKQFSQTTNFVLRFLKYPDRYGAKNGVNRRAKGPSQQKIDLCLNQVQGQQMNSNAQQYPRQRQTPRLKMSHQTLTIYLYRDALALYHASCVTEF